MIEKPFEQIELTDAFDVIASFEVIEHLFCPKDFLVWAKNALRTKGILILSCPNIEGFDTILLERHSDAVDHEHLNYFNPTSLTVLLEKAGFRNVTVTTPGVLDVDLVRRGRKNGHVDDLRLGPLLTALLDRNDNCTDATLQSFLQQVKMSSNMMAVAEASTAV